MKCEWREFHLRMNLKLNRFFRFNEEMFKKKLSELQFPSLCNFAIRKKHNIVVRRHIYMRGEINKEKRNQVSSELIFGETGETFQFSIDYRIHKKNTFLFRF